MSLVLGLRSVHVTELNDKKTYTSISNCELTWIIDVASYFCFLTFATENRVLVS